MRVPLDRPDIEFLSTLVRIAALVGGLTLEGDSRLRTTGEVRL